MTDNLKKFLEAASQNKAFFERLNKAETPETVIALAAEKGFTLTEEDLKPQHVSGEMSDAELDAVAGGKTCACVVGGIGNYLALDEYNVGYEEMRCGCALGGGGTSKD